MNHRAANHHRAAKNIGLATEPAGRARPSAADIEALSARWPTEQGAPTHAFPWMRRAPERSRRRLLGHHANERICCDLAYPAPTLT